MNAHRILSMAACASLAVLASSAARSQDVVAANAGMIQVKIDNPSVRVLEATLNPGQKENLHSHPATVIYVISGGKVRNHRADGTSVEAELATGATLYREPLTHWNENIGTTPIHLIITELKDRK